MAQFGYKLIISAVPDILNSSTVTFDNLSGRFTHVGTVYMDFFIAVWEKPIHITRLSTGLFFVFA